MVSVAQSCAAETGLARWPPSCNSPVSLSFGCHFLLAVLLLAEADRVNLARARTVVPCVGLTRGPNVCAWFAGALGPSMGECDGWSRSSGLFHRCFPVVGAVLLRG